MNTNNLTTTALLQSQVLGTFTPQIDAVQTCTGYGDGRNIITDVNSGCLSLLERISLNHFYTY
jgi:hypothetical protein